MITAPFAILLLIPMLASYWLERDMPQASAPHG
jgi:hypothetical protein